MSHARALVLGAAVLLAVVPFIAGCTGAAAGVMPSPSVTSTMEGWDHWFHIEWQPVARPDGSEIAGYVYNDYGAAAGNVRILAQGLDASGNLVGQQLGWVHGGVPPMHRSYFKIAGLPPAPQYRVTVWSFDFVQSPGIPER